jgi:hypothetical protein
VEGLQIKLFARLDLDKSHRGSGDRFCDCFGISGVILVRLHEWLNELRWDDPHGVPELAQLPSRPLRPGARLHADEGFWGCRKEGKQGVT